MSDLQITWPEAVVLMTAIVVVGCIVMAIALIRAGADN